MALEESGRVVLGGSEPADLSGARPLGPVQDDEPVRVTVLVRRRAPLPPDVLSGERRLSQEQLRSEHGADPREVRAVAEALAGAGATVVEEDPASRRVVAVGPAGALSGLFGANLEAVESPDPVSGSFVRHRRQSGPLSLPAPLAGIVTAVLGLDDRPQARPHFRTVSPLAAETSFTANQVAVLYDFPANTDGSGSTVAVVELGGGLSQSDLSAYFGRLGLPVPSVKAVSVDGASTAAGTQSSADIEVALDVEVIGAAAPGAAQVVYFAPNTDAGFHDAVADALQANPAPVAVSISWGGSEDSWSAQGRDALNEALSDAVALGITVTAAAGDSGSSDGVSGGQAHVDFPASSPYALGCGGTRLEATTASIETETVWDDLPSGGATGGGVSDVFALPSWQQAASQARRAGTGTSGRGVPDVAGDASPETGYQVIADGTQQVVGGTSAVAPLWAALVARLRQQLGRAPGFLQPALYSGVAPGQPAPGFRDITSGTNGAYSAGAGWDPCTGLGSPVGTAIEGRL